MNTKIVTFSMLLMSIFLIIGCSKTGPIKEEIIEPKICTLDWNPVCGVDNVTYPNTCVADDVTIVYEGECQTDTPAPSINNSAKMPAISEYCTSWFDGCNNCFVEHGIIGGCTRKACETLETPKCLEYIIPKDCVSWFDGCNNCGAKDGNLTMCTMMYCETPQEPKCLNFTK